MKVRWKMAAWIYVLSIPVCAGIYWANKYDWVMPESKTLPISFLESVYISVVTVTTLGYGDYTPLSSEMQTTTAAQALIGVLMLGAFLIGLAQEAGDRQSENSKKIAKANLLVQYIIWKEGVLEAMLSVAGWPEFKTPDNITKFCEPLEFKKFFGGGPKSRWVGLVEGLERNPRYVSIIQAETRILESALRDFLNKTNIEDETKLKRITDLATYLARFSNLDYTDERDQSTFGQGVWGLFGPENVMTRDAFNLNSLLKDV